MVCQFKLQNGQQCKANALKGDNLCFTHNPKSKERHLLSAKKGGQTSSDRRLLSPVQINSLADVQSVLVDTLNRSRLVDEKGIMDQKTVSQTVSILGKIMAMRLAMFDKDSKNTDSLSHYETTKLTKNTPDWNEFTEPDKLRIRLKSLLSK